MAPLAQVWLWCFGAYDRFPFLSILIGLAWVAFQRGQWHGMCVFGGADGQVESGIAWWLTGPCHH